MRTGYSGVSPAPRALETLVRASVRALAHAALEWGI
jgi:hypothetical protein